MILKVKGQLQISDDFCKFSMDQSVSLQNNCIYYLLSFSILMISKNLFISRSSPLILLLNLIGNNSFIVMINNNNKKKINLN